MVIVVLYLTISLKDRDLSQVFGLFIKPKRKEVYDD
ncbi:hypothetical protein SSU98_1106 [Streptococcus suis 98HAH33]|nr:hypothetical protein SSU05_1096 [Streptococcus suis 05ZYH33]ABP92264.1 hypothetical protein SSU98_1106 [Streptococcus suis 98HAH33]